jgi:hypothetical protein
LRQGSESQGYKQISPNPFFQPVDSRYDDASNVIETQEHRGFESAPRFPSSATALDVARHVLYVFLPKTHRVAVFADA